MNDRFELLLARAMCSDDPVRALLAAAEDPGIEEAVRAMIRAADPDGIRMSALLVAKLRFERLLRGSPEAEAWFDHDAERFSATFRAYHRAVPPTAFFPREEAELFQRWCVDGVPPLR